MGSHCTWVVVFVHGQLSGRSFPFMSSHLHTRGVGGRTRADGRGFGGWCGVMEGGYGVMEGGGGGGEAVMGSHRTWVVVFVRGQLSRRSFPFVSGRLRTWGVGGRTCADGRGFAGYCARARGGSGCRCGRGRMLVVWLPCHPRQRGPCIRCERKKGEGDLETHLHMQTVTMASIVTVWTTWHVATSSPAHSIAFCCG